jgi:hypothetical protein
MSGLQGGLSGRLQAGKIPFFCLSQNSENQICIATNSVGGGLSLLDFVLQLT